VIGGRAYYDHWDVYDVKDEAAYRSIRCGDAAELLTQIRDNITQIKTAHPHYVGEEDCRAFDQRVLRDYRITIDQLRRIIPGGIATL